MNAPPAPGRHLGLFVIGAACAVWGVFALTAANASRPQWIGQPLFAKPEVAVEPAMPEPVTEPAVAAVAPTPRPAHAFIAPLPGQQINSPFGMRQMPWEEGGRLHKGVDIAAPLGATVLATAEGVVVRSGEDSAYGQFIEVSHKDGLSSLYAHLGAKMRRIQVGSHVSAGQIIGFVGDSGRSTGSHLHFELRNDGDPLNPTYFMGKTFASVDDLPLRKAARVPRKVHLAQVSKWPEGIKKKIKNNGRARGVLASSGD